MHQVVAHPYPHQGVVVAGSISLKIVGEIERGLGQQTMADQVERNQESPDTAIAVEEGVNRLELIVADRRANQVRHKVLIA